MTIIIAIIKSWANGEYLKCQLYEVWLYIYFVQRLMVIDEWGG